MTKKPDISRDTMYYFADMTERAENTARDEGLDTYADIFGVVAINIRALRDRVDELEAAAMLSN